MRSSSKRWRRSRSNSSSGNEACAPVRRPSSSNPPENSARPACEIALVSAPACDAQIGAHAAQILFDLAAGARRGAGADHRRRHFRQSRRASAPRSALPLRKKSCADIFGNVWIPPAPPAGRSKACERCASAKRPDAPGRAREHSSELLKRSRLAFVGGHCAAPSSAHRPRASRSRGSAATRYFLRDGLHFAPA